MSETRKLPSLELMPMLAVAAFVAMVHVAWYLGFDWLVVNGDLADGDSFARLVRVTLLYETGDWFNSAIPRSNAPFGDVSHWTRLFDVILLVLALPVTPLLGFTKALYYAGAVASPLLHVLTAAALAWAAAPVVGRAGAYVAGALTATGFGVLGYAVAGHADHHLLFALITVLAFGFLVRALAGQGGHAMAAGAFIAVGVWSGTETFVFLGLCLLTTGLMWVAGEKGAARLNFQLVLGLALGLTSVLLVERGPGHYIDVEFDRVSIIHLSVAALLSAFWGVVLAVGARWEETSPAVRLIIGAGGAAVALAALRLLFPDALNGPMADVDPELLPIFAGIAEYSPIADVAHFLIYVGSILIVLPWILWRLREEWRSGERWVWLFLVFAVTVFAAFAVNWIRWSMYVGLFSSIVLSDLLFRVDGVLSARPWGAVRILAKAGVALLLVMGSCLAGIALLDKQETGSRDRTKRECDLKTAAAFLNLPRWADRPYTIVTSVNFGNELMYRTNHLVLSTLLHRNSSGILDAIRLLGSTDEQELARLVHKRRVDLILICLSPGSFSRFTEKEDQRVLVKRLLRGDFPPRIGEVQLPPEMKDEFRLFQIQAP